MDADPLLAVYVYLLERAKARDKARAAVGKLAAAQEDGDRNVTPKSMTPDMGGLTHNV